MFPELLNKKLIKIKGYFRQLSYASGLPPENLTHHPSRKDENSRISSSKDNRYKVIHWSTLAKKCSAVSWFGRFPGNPANTFNKA